ncbi:hypothetical protein RHECIAT_CH0004308 [Rhizobium etli CIAT 652]|uniref:Uncharacterized protein n=1 Tax=Rhizobium etli (strain CIAT 652) TaxID=491916 RepID=B3PR82_RHIE6|nr:hypothetical protein RHECIAT_CH0004308 [Rhizobium etli CIAT 652]
MGRQSRLRIEEERFHGSNFHEFRRRRSHRLGLRDKRGLSPSQRSQRGAKSASPDCRPRTSQPPRPLLMSRSGQPSRTQKRQRSRQADAVAQADLARRPG